MTEANLHPKQKTSAGTPDGDVQFVTTSRRATEAEVKDAVGLAERLGLPYKEREGPLRPEDGAILVVTKEKLVIESSSGPLFFHPGMAKPRIAALRQGRRDVMVDAMGLEEGMAVLDGTLGLGADAIVTSYVTGSQGRVVGVEAVPALAEVVAQGLAAYVFPHDDIVEAMRRIQVVPTDHRQYLTSQGDGSFDVVYFDPLFQDPVRETIHMQPWRQLGSRRSLDKDVIDEAMRVARHRVVVKERQGSDVFRQLGIDRIVGGKGSRIAYGVLEVSP